MKLAACLTLLGLFGGASAAPTKMKMPKTVVDVVAEEDKLSTLVAAVSAYPDVVAALMTDGPFTVFAPTNKAFKKVMKEYPLSMYAPDNMWKYHLLDLLAYHVLAGIKASSMDASNGDMLPMLNGEDVKVSVSKNGLIKLNKKSRVIKPDLEAKNGFVHIINKVLLPTSAMKNIVEMGIADEQFSTLVDLVVAAGLVDVLTGDGPFTLFAPTNDAFAKLDPKLVKDLLKPKNKDMLVGILKYHVLPGIVTSFDLSDGLMAKTVQGCKIEVSIKMMGDKTTVRIKESVEAKGAMVSAANVLASNGVIHVIDDVLVPMCH